VQLIRRILLPLCLAGVLALACAPSAGAAAMKAIWGPVSYPTGNSNCPSGTQCSAFPTYKQLGADNYEMQVPWDRVAVSRPANPRNPNDPAYTWPTYADRAIQQAAQYGMSVTILVQGTPAWANGGKGRQWVPDRMQDYADFMYAASLRYPTVHHWMVWGEVNYGANFQPMPEHSPVGPRTYAQLCDLAYAALKQASPANIVIGGDTLNANVPVSPAEFIRWARVGKGKKKRPPRLDWWGHNPFEGRFPDIRQPALNNLLGLSDADTLHKLLKKAYVGKKKKKSRKRRKANASAHVSKKKGKKKARRHTPPIWFSEYSVLSGHPAHFWLGFYVSDQEQAQWVSSAYQLVNSVPYVAGLGWYRLDDEPEASGSANWGLVTYTGQRKASFGAYAAAP
jgi:hypothetical protein